MTMGSTARRRTMAGMGGGVAAGVLAVMLVLPALAQESLLPEGFGNTPAPTPAPAPTPTPAPSSGSGQPKAAAPASSTPSGGGSSAGAAPAKTATAATTTDAESEEDSEPGVLRYDLPPGARRQLTRIGPLTPDNGGMASDAFGVRGKYASLIMRETAGAPASRWSTILLRRALLSAIDTPRTVNGADLAAERAGLLLRMGEAQNARLIVQSVDHDRASPRMVQVAQQVFLANADPAGLCPYVPAGLGQFKDDQSWRLAAGICSGLQGEPGPAGWAVDKVRNGKKIALFDVLLAERVLGASVNGRRAVTIQWDGIDRLTPWRFGLATATATPIPAPLIEAASGAMKSWAVLAPMTQMADRIAQAPEAARRGVLSNEAYVSLLSAAVLEEEPAADTVATADLLRTASAAPTAEQRVEALRKLWGGADGTNADKRYAAMVLTARAAAAMPVGADLGDDLHWLIGSMLAGGYDRNALAWVPTVSIGSRAWGVMAVGLPRPLKDVTADSVDDFSGDDDSANYRRSQFLLAGLMGLGRISDEEAKNAAESLDADFAKATAWTRAIDEAATRGEPGMVALLAAAGLQGGWDRIPPYHLYHVVKALREVGLASEARMIAAEALVRI